MSSTTSPLLKIFKPAKLVCHFVEMQEQYRLTKERDNKRTRLSSLLIDVNVQLNILKLVMNETSEISASSNHGLESMISSMQTKAGLLQKVLVQCLTVSSLISETDVMKKMQKRLTQVNKRGNNLKQAVTPDMNFECYNSKITWTDAYVALENNGSHKGLDSKQELIRHGSYIQQEFSLSVQQLGISNAMVEKIMMVFPVMKVTQGDNVVLVDRCELLLQKDCFLQLLLCQVKENSSTESKDLLENVPEDKAANTECGAQKKDGRGNLRYTS